ncbi:MAG: hypothetical protein ACR2H3_08420 [Acidimicrobiales bacterium]
MAEEAGEVATCPECAAEVKQKSMIPVLGPDGKGHTYLCVACARALIPPEDADENAGDGTAQDAAADG